MSACTNQSHDHTDDANEALACAFCGRPMHYDYDAESYYHDELAVACWATPAGSELATPCEVAA